MRVLAVDDERSILELLSEALPVFGFDEVYKASSAQDALDLLSTEKPQIDCFLLDIQMPYMDGIALCGEIRRLEAYKDVPIVMLTAMSEKAYVDEAFKMGATDYVTKPFDMTELSTRVRLACRRKHTAPTNSNKSVAQDGPETLDGVERVISLAAFENYILQLTRARLVTSGLFAIKIPELAVAPAGLSVSQERQFRTHVAQAISQASQYDQSIISYAEDGVFVVLNKSWGTNKKETLQKTIGEIFENLDTDDPALKRLKPTVFVGGTVSLPAFGRPFTLSYLQKAIQKAEQLCAKEQLEAAPPRKRLKRRRGPEPHMREYKKIFSELIADIDPIGDERKKKIVPRRVAALSPSVQQTRTAV